MPLKYPSVAAELNVISILAVLDVTLGCRAPLYEATGRGAHGNIRILVMALYLSSTTEEADYMSAESEGWLPCITGRSRISWVY
jgi:hypothetical protein